MQHKLCLIPALVVIIALNSGCVELAQSPLVSSLTGATNNASALNESTVASGLKDALRLGSERAIALTSAKGGFLDNKLIRIPMPESLQNLASTLRNVGMGAYVDEFEGAMNQAAENASGEAQGVFMDAITSMSMADAMGILQGGDTAATDYFRETTSDQLTQKLKPMVQEKMTQVGVYDTYTKLVNAYTALPFTAKPQLNLEQYVVDKARDGVFTMLAAEEVKLRTNPATRTTELLKKVFAAQD